MINQFNLDRLSGFEWSQKQAEMDQMAACSEANATECAIDQQARCISCELAQCWIDDHGRVSRRGYVCVERRAQSDEQMDV